MCVTHLCIVYLCLCRIEKVTLDHKPKPECRALFLVCPHTVWATKESRNKSKRLSRSHAQCTHTQHQMMLKPKARTQTRKSARDGKNTCNKMLNLYRYEITINRVNIFYSNMGKRKKAKTLFDAVYSVHISLLTIGDINGFFVFPKLVQQ